MAGSLPTVRGGASVLFPFVKRVTFDTGVTTMADGSEQRFARRGVLYEFDFTYQNLDPTDTASIVTFIANQKGMFESDWSFTLDGTTYSNLTLLTDSADFIQKRGLVYDVKFSARQVKNGSWTPPSVPTAWPALASGATVQYPYGFGFRSLTSENDSPTGMQYSYAWNAAGLSGFPARQLRRFPVSLPSISDVDAAMLETFFLGTMGRLQPFTFTDPYNSTTYTVRCDTDKLELRWSNRNRVTANLMLVETN